MTELKVTSTVFIDEPRERVWRALTDPAELFEWYAPGCRWEIPELCMGGQVRFFNTETDVQRATIEAVEPQTMLALLWTPDERFPAAKLLNSYRLEDDGKQTRVTLEQSGYETAPGSLRDQWLRQDQQAFAAIAAALKAHVESH